LTSWSAVWALAPNGASMARLAASAMRNMHSLPVYARPFFLTLTVNNLPGIRHKKEKLLPIFPLEPFRFD
jgi:hypothetical protein